MTAENGERDPVTGQFVKGSSGGPGRPRKRTALHTTIDDDVTARLWRAELAAADSGDAEARRFILGHKQGRPAPAAPDCGKVDWPEVMGADHLPAAVNALLAAHARGDVDLAAMEFLTGVLGEMAKIIETADLAPKLRRLEEYVEAQGGSL